MKDYKIVPLTEEDAELLSDKLGEYTGSKIDFEDCCEDELVVYKIEDEEGNIIGGCNMYISSWGIADLDILWVDEKYRHQGLGTALYKAAEKAARERGCYAMTLGTFDFQARPFYEKHGFSLGGTLENCPREHEHYDMFKKLDTSDKESVSSKEPAFEIKSGSEEDAEFIDDSLCEYNWSNVPKERDFEAFGNEVLDDEGKPVGGCYAGINPWNIAFVEVVWVDEPLRRQGLGSKLLLEAEQQAKENGAHIALVDARDWNLDFFKKLGYTVYCIQEDYPKGYRKYKMQKIL